MPVGGPAFSSVRKAREALKERAHELLDLQISIIKAALAEGDFETAAKANQFLIEHVPDEDGERMIDSSPDKKQIDSAGSSKGPSITIGVAIGGLGQKQLDTPVIDVVNVRPDDSN